MSEYMRTELGEFSSIVCFKAVITGMEDLLGVQATGIALKGAGRKRGVRLVESLGFSRGSATMAQLPQIAQELNKALGTSGTKLCLIDRIESHGEVVRVYARETVCSAHELPGSTRECTFTLGAVHGAIEYLLDESYTARHVECVLRGHTHDVFELTPR
jgi:predicted hydrocarbon binding protein